MASKTAATQTAMENGAKTLERTSQKAPATEDVFEQFDRIYNSIARRAFEIFSGDGHVFGRDLENWFRAEAELLHPVHMNVTESDGVVNVAAEVPGFEAKDLEIKLEPNRLTISGKRETKEDQKKGRTVYHEHCANEILRIVELPAEVDTAKAEARLKNGILDMRLPKGKAANTVHVQVKTR